MAKVGNCSGGFSGKIGNVVYYYCNGNLYARRRPYRKMLVRSKNQQLFIEWCLRETDLGEAG